MTECDNSNIVVGESNEYYFEVWHPRCVLIQSIKSG